MEYVDHTSLLNYKFRKSIGRDQAKQHTETAAFLKTIKTSKHIYKYVAELT